MLGGRATNGPCPLCDQPAHIEPSQEIDGDGVLCDRCGYYRLQAGALRGYEQERYLLSGITRRASSPPAVDTRVTITRDNIEQTIAHARSSANLLDQLDAVLQYAKARQTRSDQFVEYQQFAADDYLLAFTHDSDEFLHCFRTLAAQELVDEPPGRDPARRTSFRITPAGWERLRELAKTSRDSNRAFVAMWFDGQMDDAWAEGVKPALEALSYVPVRIDQTHAEDPIDDRILAEIRRSGLVVADFSGHRHGVYFEAGFAMGLGIPVVWTCREDEFQHTHFDTRQYQHLVWQSPNDLREKLVNHIAARIPGRQLPPGPP